MAMAASFSSRELNCKASCSSSSTGYAKFPGDFPSHKRIPGTRFVVDGFGWAGAWSTAYFLSHFHSDHYGGLTAAWDKGIIFCSGVTRRLLLESLRVDGSFVVQLPMDAVVDIDGCKVTLVDANHCPGAVQMLFEVPPSPEDAQGSNADGCRRFVHTGDMRYSPLMKADASLCNFVGADAVFLDTTYCNPRFVFPPQQQSISYVVDTIHELMGAAAPLHSTLFLISTYVIGKEKILAAVAKRCNTLLYVDERKLALLKCLDLEDVTMRALTTDPAQACVHVVSWNWLGETWPFFRPNFSNMEQLRRERGVERVVGFVPTGWTHEAKGSAFPVRRRDLLEIHLVPYSEHSNYDELREYIGFLRPRDIVPTVGLDAKGMDGKTVAAMRKHFRNLVDETASKRKFLKGFKRSSNTSSGGGADSNLEQEFCEHLTALGRNARKRQREGTEEDQQPVSMGVGVSVIEEAPLATKIQLQNVLPSWVTDSQIDRLLGQAAGDLNAAVSLFFEQQSTLQREDEKVDNAACGSEDVGATKLVGTSPAGIGSSPKLSSQVVTTPSPARKSKSASTKRPKGSKNKLKPKGLALQIRGQPSILSFFKKESTSSSAIAADSSVLTHKAVQPGADAECEKLKQLLTILEGDVSETRALALLEEGRGDVGVALDLFYGTKDKDELSVSLHRPLLRKCDQVGLRVTEAPSTAEADSKQQKQEFPDGNRLSGRTLLTKETPKIEKDIGSVALTLSRYDPRNHACWSADEPAPYLHLARTFDLVEKESGRHKTTEMLCNMFRSLLAFSPEDVLPALYLTTNRIAPDYENVDLNIGASSVVAAIEEATGTPKSKLKEMYNSMGDLGDVAQACRQTQSMLIHPRSLSIRHVFDTLKRLSNETGSGSGARKRSMILSLLRSCREKEVTYLVRTLVQNMRIGAMIRTVLPALAQAVVLHQDASNAMKLEHIKPKLQEASTAIVEAFNLLPNFDRLVPYLLDDGVEALSSCVVLSPGVPIKPMLAKITNGLPEILKHFEGKGFTCEYKYDGYRAQIHLLEDGSVRIFSRNCENSTSRFPDVAGIIQTTMRQGVRSFIVDAEVVAVDRANNNKLMAFQSLSTRERGSRTGMSVNIDNIKVDVCIFLFDLIYADGEPLVKTPFRLRRQRMHDIFPNVRPGYLDFAAEMHVDPPTDPSVLSSIQEFLDEAIAASCEGLMVKALDEGSEYAPAKRGDSWLKVKRDYVDGLSDSLDLMPIGAWWGNGRKAGWYSPFLLACYDPDREEFQSVCRVMSGFTDAFYEEMKAFYGGERVLSRKPPYYRTLEQPEVWFPADRVWEIRGADLTVSPVHQAAVGLVHPSRGISLRFPRFVGERSDKRPEDATSPSEIADLFQAQTRKLE